MPAKRKEVSPPTSAGNSPDKKAAEGADDGTEDNLPQYLSLLRIFDDLAKSKKKMQNLDMGNTESKREILHCAQCVIRRLRDIPNKDRYIEDSLMCISHWIDLRFERPSHDSTKSFEEWLGEKNWTEKAQMRSVDSQRFVLAVFEKIDEMHKGRFSSQKGEDVAEASNEVLNDLSESILCEAYEELIEEEIKRFETMIRCLSANPQFKTLGKKAFIVKLKADRTHVKLHKLRKFFLKKLLELAEFLEGLVTLLQYMAEDA